MRLAFTKGPDYSLTSVPSTVVSNVYHGARIAVDRYGTVAAAATADVRVSNSAPSAWVRADRPFLFVVRDKRSGLILFMGRLMDPRR